jgi:hypothetical protein
MKIVRMVAFIWLPIVGMAAAALIAFSGCSSDRPVATASATPLTAPTATVAAAATASPGAGVVGPSALAAPVVTTMADGSLRLGPRITDVAMLNRQPDGTFRRVCGPPDAETRAMLDGKLRARRWAR